METKKNISESRRGIARDWGRCWGYCGEGRVEQGWMDMTKYDMCMYENRMNPLIHAGYVC